MFHGLFLENQTNYTKLYAVKVSRNKTNTQAETMKYILYGLKHVYLLFISFNQAKM